MDSNPLSNTTNQTEDKKKNKQKLKEQVAPPPPSNTASPTTSPSHEFSFTISLHSSNPNSKSTSAAAPSSHDWNCKTPNNSFAIDLSPADEIFFHGHLLPLHLLSHLPTHPSSSISPRSSTSSAALPVTKDIILDHYNNRDRSSLDVPPKTTRNSSPKHVRVAKKSKSFSLFGLPGWKQSGERDHESSKRKKQRKFSHLLKRYMAMVKKPLLSFKQQMRKGEDDDMELYIDRDSSYSFSGQINGGGGVGRNNNNNYVKKKQEFSSAPASMRTSPTNSGLLVPVPTLHSDNSSTMEELQAAIQAAIAHCKNSIATADQGGKLVKA